MVIITIITIMIITRIVINIINKTKTIIKKLKDLKEAINILSLHNKMIAIIIIKTNHWNITIVKVQAHSKPSQLIL